jgi:hypothetical protein
MSDPTPRERPDAKNPATSKDRQRRRWEAPRLVDHGSIRHFVRAASGRVSDVGTTGIVIFMTGLKPG